AKKGMLHAFTNHDTSMEEHRVSDSKGYIQNNSVYNDHVLKSTEHLYQSLKQDRFNWTKFNYLYEVVARIQQNGSEVIFFELPTHRLQEYYSKDYLLQYALGVEKIKQKYKHISLNMVLDGQDFGNIDHLNHSGAKKVTELFIKEFNFLSKE
ncbi:MAG TPA: hypothetical protein VL947_14300, partial [Cytophagales bacterium]|nr:hypothetical protein [Cytophagales bacterium]